MYTLDIQHVLNISVPIKPIEAVYALLCRNIRYVHNQRAIWLYRLRDYANICQLNLDQISYVETFSVFSYTCILPTSPDLNSSHKWSSLLCKDLKMTVCYLEQTLSRCPLREKPWDQRPTYSGAKYVPLRNQLGRLWWRQLSPIYFRVAPILVDNQLMA